MNLKKDNIKIKITNQTKEYWITQEFISDNLRNELKNSNILFIPEIWKEDNIGFQKDVYPFYEYLEQQNTNDEINIGFCIEDEDYKELHLHSDILWLGMILIEHFYLPLFINLLSDYLSDHFFHNSDDEIDIKLNIQNNNDKNVLIEYQGNCDNFIKIINEDKFLRLIENEEE